jgi:hypothetical protein
MSLPNRKDYIDAIKNARVCVRDPVLKGGHPEYGDDGDLVFSFGSFAGVFLITCAGKRYALRCWISQIDDPAHRYQLVKQYLEKVRLPYFLDFEYVEHGIFADIGTQPILRMDWIEDKSLRDFIEDHLKQPHVLRAAAQNFLVMAQALHSSQIAHGDLQSENLRVRINGGGPEFTLIDYDTLFVPGLLATKVSTTGLPGFQHPKRSQIATAKDDYFAELVIYLTFHALAQRPQLWHEEDMEKREKELLFTPTDFVEEYPTDRFHKLRGFDPPVDKLAVLLWNYTRCDDIRLLLPLEEAVDLCARSTIVRSRTDFRRRLAAKKSTPSDEDWLVDLRVQQEPTDTRPETLDEGVKSPFEAQWEAKLSDQESEQNEKPFEEGWWPATLKEPAHKGNHAGRKSFEEGWAEQIGLETRPMDLSSLKLDLPPTKSALSPANWELLPEDLEDHGGAHEATPVENFWARWRKLFLFVALLASLVLFVFLIIVSGNSPRDSGLFVALPIAALVLVVFLVSRFRS